MLKRKLTSRGGPPPSKGVNIPHAMIDMLGWGGLTHIGLTVERNGIFITKFREESK